MLSRVAHHVVTSAVCAATAGADEAAAITPSPPLPPRRRMLLSRKRADPLPSDVVPLRVDRQVHPLPQELARVHDAIAAAVAHRDFREAALLQDLLHVVDPKPSLTVEACAPELPEDARDFFLREGFVCVQNCFTQEHLWRLQEAWRRAQEEPQKLWEEARLVAGNFSGEDFQPSPKFSKLPHGRLFYDIPLDIFLADYRRAYDRRTHHDKHRARTDAVLLDLVDPPRLMKVLHEVIGPDVRLSSIQPRTVPAEQGPSEGGYTSWHRYLSLSVLPCLSLAPAAFFL